VELVGCMWMIPILFCLFCLLFGCYFLIIFNFILLVFGVSVGNGYVVGVLSDVWGLVFVLLAIIFLLGLVWL